MSILMNAHSSSATTQSPARQSVERLSIRLKNERQELVLFLVELGAFDAQQLALELGYPSTLGCLMGELGLSESSACRRIAAARLLARFPQIALYLLASRLSLTGLVVLKEVLDESNVDALLERAAGLSEPEVRQLVTRLRFNGVASTVTVAPGQEVLATAPAAAVAADGVATSRSEQPVVEEPAPRQALEAMTLWVTPEFREELAAVGALLSHAVPSGKTVDVLLHVLRAQRRVLERRRHGSPRRKEAKAASAEVKATAPATENDRYIVAEVRRVVFEREAGSCAFVGEDGRRCGSKRWLEYHHREPFACGGPATADNLTLYCHAHNKLQAKRDFGEAHVLYKSAVAGLVRLGCRRKEAEEAVRMAMERLPREADLAALVRESLRALRR
jgi:hypothetical protein